MLSQGKNTRSDYKENISADPAGKALVLELQHKYSSTGAGYIAPKPFNSPKKTGSGSNQVDPPAARRKDPVVHAWGSYLDQRQWQLWTTLTTGRELTLPGARRSINKLSQYLKENGYPAEIFWAAEPFDLKEGYHLHSLVRFVDLAAGEDNKSQYNGLVKGWRQITGDQSARIYSERYKEDKGAHYYVGKYITKARSDYDIIMPGINNNHDQLPEAEYQDAMSARLLARAKERSKEMQRKMWVSELQEKGIYAGKGEKDKPVYNDTRTTFENWERKEYERDLTAHLTVYRDASKICVGKFTLSKNA